MNIRVQLAELCANRKLSMDEYKKLAAFSIMERESVFVERIEKFRLPEITKLICGSEFLRKFSWAHKYEKIRPLYCTMEAVDVTKIISEYKDINDFEKHILFFADENILQIFSQYYDTLIECNNKKNEAQAKLKKEIDEEKKKDEDSNEKSTILDKEKKLEAIDEELTELGKTLVQYERYMKKIHEYEKEVQKIDSDENREKAYHFLNDMTISNEEKFLKSFISSGNVSEEYHMQFYNKSFVNRVLKCLDKGTFRDYSFPILLKLYDEGAIDLVEGPASDFIDQHPKRLCEYLLEKTPISVETLNDSEFELLIEKAIQKEIGNLFEKKITFFSDFWNTIIDFGVWSWIVEKIKLIENENINIALSQFLFQLKGKAAKSLIKVLFDESELDSRISVCEIISYLLKNGNSSEKDVIMNAVRSLEQSNRKIQRRLNTSERKLRSHSQELFSSVYLPMEQLEELAIDLKLTEGDIKASLVATHLINIILSLREGFESLDLLPVADTEDWKFQNNIKFNPEMHRVTGNIDCTLDAVSLKSLGFRYRDDDGEWKQYNAKASVEINIPEAKKGVHREDSKNKKSSEKKKKSDGCRIKNKKTKKKF